ncbi:hypothetical protein TWF730_009107 [Orbilia blumenaviensis]|uniref:Uncharacterized protein n=1 Tax=Orbilia blumenaviensis TaxID=1796055 RepID=A0AAV9V038_9PEZI
MTPYTPFCAICGTRITREGTDTARASNEWLSDIRLLYLASDGDPNPPFVSEKARIPEFEGDWPEVWDPSEGTYKILECDLFFFCYPIHNICLEIFRDLAFSCGVVQFSQEVYLHLLGLFGDLPTDNYRVYFPSEWGGISEYQKAVSGWPWDNYIPTELEYVEVMPANLSDLHRELDE